MSPAEPISESVARVAAPPPAPPPPPGRHGLELIAGFKFLQAATLFVVGLGAFGLINPWFAGAAQGWLERLALGNGERLVIKFATHALPYLDAAAPRQFLVLGIGAFLYGGVFLVEGVGLWRCKRWAEYLTIVITASLLPVELIALYRRLTVVRVGALVINVLVIVYLAWQLRASRRMAERAQGEPSTGRAT